MHDTLNVFQAEWYRLEATASLDLSKIGKVPLMYLDFYYFYQKLRIREFRVSCMRTCVRNASSENVGALEN
jgi:hypothetical protein